jgi:hypothetical protein
LLQRAVKLFQQEVQQVQDALSRTSAPNKDVNISPPLPAAAATAGEGAGPAGAGGSGEEVVAGYKEVLKAMEDMLQFAVAHRDVVAKWGRFPHRNKVLGRAPTPEEEQGMKEGTIPNWG